MGCRGWGLVLLALALSGPPVCKNCLTYQEKTLGRWHSLCTDGSRAIHTYNRTLDRWNTTITKSPRQTCTGQMNPRTRRVEVRCR